MVLTYSKKYIFIFYFDTYKVHIHITRLISGSLCQILLGWDKCHQSSTKKKIVPYARKFFVHFGKNCLITPVKTVLSMDLAHYEMKIQVFFIYFHFFVEKLSFCPPQGILGGGKLGLGGGGTCPPQDPQMTGLRTILSL